MTKEDIECNFTYHAPKDGRNGRKQLMSRRESASILGTKYHEDGEHDD